MRTEETRHKNSKLNMKAKKPYLRNVFWDRQTEFPDIMPLTAEELCDITISDEVLVVAPLDFTHDDVEFVGERIWVRIVEILGHYLIGEVVSKLGFTELHKLDKGDIIRFQRCNVFDIDFDLHST